MSDARPRVRSVTQPRSVHAWLATPEEAPVVAGLLVEFRDHLGHSSPPESSFLASVKQLLADSETEFWLASAAQDGVAAGVCQLRFRHCVWTAAEDCWLEDLFVRPGARGLGLGRTLVSRAIERARERGCRRIELDTTADNRDAIALYERLGFSAASKGSRSLFYGLRLSR